ncbi:MAG: hypothetical protein JJT94_13615 [Bernardetiaceae bacterium]|nr:hypothetical protein [Bernardetiaceae bacterium]
MNLDDFKSSWKVYNAHTIDQLKVGKEQIKQMLAGKTQDIVSKIQRNIRYELVVNYVFFILLSIGYFFYPTHITSDPAERNVLYAIWIFVLVTSTVYYALKYHQISQIKHSSETLKVRIKSIVDTMQKYLKIYLYFSLAIVPITIFGLIIASTDSNAKSSLLAWIVIIGITCVTVAIVYVFTQWYINKVYGNYVKGLKSCLHELSENEDAPL